MMSYSAVSPASFLSLLCGNHLPKHDLMSAETSDARQKYLCSKCTKVFESRDDKLIHEKDCDVTGYICGGCGRTYRTKLPYEKHVISCNNNAHQDAAISALSLYKCDQCQHYFKTEKYLAAHLLRCSTQREVFVCALCQRKYKSQVCYQKHLKRCQVRSKETYKCDYCHRSFKTKKYVYDHMRRCGNEPDTFTCISCHEAFRSRLMYEKHARQCQNQQLGTELYKCDICQRSFKTKNYVHQHMRQCGVKREVFPCETCQREFKSRTCYDKHIQKCSTKSEKGCLYQMSPDVSSVVRSSL